MGPKVNLADGQADGRMDNQFNLHFKGVREGHIEKVTRSFFSGLNPK